MKLSYWIIVGKTRLAPKLEWQRAASGWRAKIAGQPYFYKVEREAPKNKNEVTVWYLKIYSGKRNRRINIAGRSHFELAMVYTSVAARAIAELIESEEKDFIPYKIAPAKKIFVGKERRYLDEFSWEIKGSNYAYNKEEFDGYYLSRNYDCKKDDPWDLRIIFPGGADSPENCGAWELKGIDSLRIGQAIVALMRV
ncbi:MAG TPA: hypothetical protein VMC41_04530 [Candidatus Nanoarchaeia archaeon]|nr:hypothetical protein [Candidatus Nanoarchaeia archaeon]